jgi:hypothetical protein
MYVRVVRFGDVNSAQMETMLARIRDAGGPPEGVNSSGIRVLHDESQGTSVVLQMFPTLDDMKTGDRVFGAMDPGDTPGRRLSVDMCELKLDLEA